MELNVVAVVCGLEVNVYSSRIHFGKLTLYVRYTKLAVSWILWHLLGKTLICRRQTLEPESPHVLLNFSCDGLWLLSHSSFKGRVKGEHCNSACVFIEGVVRSRTTWICFRSRQLLSAAKKRWKKKYFGNTNSGRLYINSEEINLWLKILYRCWSGTCLGLRQHKLVVYNFLMQSQN